VDVVVPTFNNGEVVTECIGALDDPVVAQVVVVDDVSADATLDVLTRLAPQATVVALDEHRGLSHAFNRGVDRGSAPYVLFLNDDVIASDGAVARLVHHLETDPALAFAGGRLVDPETLETQHPYKPRAVPSTVTLVARLLGVERYWPGNPWSGQHLRDPIPDEVPSIIEQQVAGACLMVRRSTLEELGGWDESFWFWYEDVDMGARLLRRGKGVWDPRAAFLHLGRHSTRAWDKPKQHARLYHSTLLYAKKHLPGPGRWLIGAVTAAVCLVRVPVYLAKRRRAASRIYLALAKQAVAVGRGRDPGPPAAAAVRRRTSVDGPR